MLTTPALGLDEKRHIFCSLFLAAVIIYAGCGDHGISVDYDMLDDPDILGFKNNTHC